MSQYPVRNRRSFSWDEYTGRSKRTPSPSLASVKANISAIAVVPQATVRFSAPRGVWGWKCRFTWAAIAIRRRIDPKVEPTPPVLAADIHLLLYSPKLVLYINVQLWEISRYGLRTLQSPLPLKPKYISFGIYGRYRNYQYIQCTSKINDARRVGVRVVYILKRWVASQSNERCSVLCATRWKLSS